MTPLSVLELAPESMKQVEDFSESIIRDIKNGVVTEQKVRSLIYGFQKTFEEIRGAMITKELP